MHASGQGLGEGCTAFCTFALVKAGVSRKDPAVQKGLNNALSRIKKADGDFCHCYCVACLILLLEAYYTEDEPKEKEEEEEEDKGWVTKVAKKKEDPAKKLRRRAPAAQVQLIGDLVKWLVSKQEPQKLHLAGESGFELLETWISPTLATGLLAYSAWRSISPPDEPSRTAR